MDDNGWKLWNALKSHTEWKVRSAKLGKPLLEIPFPAVVYMQRTGENNHDEINTERANRVSRDISSCSVNITDKIDFEFDLSKAGLVGKQDA